MSHSPTANGETPTQTNAFAPHSGLAPDSIPERIGRYDVVDRLGEGGMGVVYAAHDTELDRPVALKLIRAGENSRSQLRLVREAQAMARLSHPNVVQIYEVGTIDTRVYLAMELIVGRTIGVWARERKNSAKAIIDAFVQAGRGLQAAHEVGIVHRDFKPSNVLVSDRGRVCVADFGIASYHAEGVEPTAEPKSPRSLLTHQLTQTGAAIGTPRYMAPEQQRGQASDAKLTDDPLRLSRSAPTTLPSSTRIS